MLNSSFRQSALFTDEKLPWCARQDWQSHFPHIHHWHWLSSDLPSELGAQKLYRTGVKQLILVEHPWQVSWLQAQWQRQQLATPMTEREAVALPEISTLSAYITQVLDVRYPEALTQQSAAITVLRALGALRQTLRSRANEGGTQFTDPLQSSIGRWALSQQLVALLAEVEGLKGIQPEILERLLSSPSDWLSREAQWLKAVQASLQGNEGSVWALQGKLLHELAQSNLLLVMPAAHPSPAMQALLAVLPSEVPIAMPDPHRNALAVPKLMQCLDFEAEAQAAMHWVLRPEHDGKRIGVVAHNRALARRLSALLARHDIAVDDRVGWALSTTVAATVVKGVLDVISDDDPMATLQWLSLPIVQNAWAGAAGCLQSLQEIWEHQEIMPEGGVILRQALQKAKLRNDEIQLTLLQNILLWQVDVPRSVAVPAHAQKILDLLAPARLLLQGDPAGALVWRCIEALTLEPNLEPVPFSVFSRLLQTQLENERFAPAIPDAQLSFLPMHEAAWSGLDAVLMMGCNELHFPAQAPNITPLLASVRRELGMPVEQPERATWNQLMNSGTAVTASFAVYEQGNPTRVSPWLIAYEATPFALPVQSNPIEAAPAVPVGHLTPYIAGVSLPPLLSVTKLATLGQCPYKFMLSSALNIKRAQEPALWPTYRERGNLLHALLSSVMQSKPKPETLESALRSGLDALYDAHLAESGRYVALFEDAKRLIPAFVAQQQSYAEQGWHVDSVELEQVAQAFFEGLDLKGKTDRIDRRVLRVSEGHSQGEKRECEYAVIDYKTSSEKTLSDLRNDVLSDAQLVLYAALLMAKGIHVTQALYWRLNDKSCKQYDIYELAQAQENVVTAFSAAWQGLKAGESALALPSKKACGYCDFAGVCRTAAWSFDEDESGEKTGNGSNAGLSHREGRYD